MLEAGAGGGGEGAQAEKEDEEEGALCVKFREAQHPAARTLELGCFWEPTAGKDRTGV